MAYLHENKDEFLTAVNIASKKHGISYRRRSCKTSAVSFKEDNIILIFSNFHP